MRQLIIQHSWVYWTKQSRGADRAIQRPRLDQPAALPALPQDGETVWRHDRFAVEPQSFDLHELWRSGEPPQTAAQVPGREDIVNLRRRGPDFELRLREPFASARQTRWPVLPSPLRTITKDDLIRIDWNARVRQSLFGSHRGSFFVEHTIFIACTEAPALDMFLTRQPVRQFDFTTRIY